MVIKECSCLRGAPFFFPFHKAVFVLLATFVLLVPCAQAEESPERESAIFLPFTVELSGSYGYLRDGLTSVLASRVAKHTGVRVVYGTPVSSEIASYLQEGQQEKAFKTLNKIHADYLVMGSMAEDGGKFLLTVTVVPRNKGGAPMQFDRHAETINDALPMMDELAWDVAAEVFGVERPQKVEAGTKGDVGMGGFQTAHPDRAYKEGMFAGILPGFDSGDMQLIEIRRSPKVPLGINDVDAADLDRDGNEELVLATTDQLYIYRYIDGHFKRVGSIDLPGYLRVHAISIADLNGNGLPEIFVSANNEGLPESMVLEWDGHQERTLQQRLPYYLQVASPEGKPVLLGQVGAKTGTSGVIGKEVYRLVQNDDGTYGRGEQLVIPDGLTVFDIAFADLDNSGEYKLIAINSGYVLQVYDKSGKLLWTDPGQYGSSSNYLGTMATAARSDRRVYVPTRIVTRDVNGDGMVDIVVAKNRMKEIKYLKRYRYFEGSSIAALGWREGKLVPLWETKKLPEYTVNLQVLAADGTGDGKGEQNFRLFFAQGQNNFSFAFWERRATSLLMYEIGLKNQQDE